MALTTTLSTKELERVATEAYTGKAVRISLHNNTAGLTAEDTIAAWDAVKLTATNGYADFTVASLPAGAYDSGTDGRFEIGGTAGANTYIEASFTATGAGFSFNTVVIRVDNNTYPHSILVESPNVTVAAGQTQTYKVQLLVDNI